MTDKQTPELVLEKGPGGTFSIYAPGQGHNGGKLVVCQRSVQHSHPATAEKLHAYGERIVQCVNAHDELVAALTDLTDWQVAQSAPQGAEQADEIDLDWLFGNADMVLARCLKFLRGDLQRDVNLLRNSIRFARASLPAALSSPSAGGELSDEEIFGKPPPLTKEAPTMAQSYHIQGGPRPRYLDAPEQKPEGSVTVDVWHTKLATLLKVKDLSVRLDGNSVDIIDVSGWRGSILLLTTGRGVTSGVLWDDEELEGAVAAGLVWEFSPLVDLYFTAGMTHPFQDCGGHAHQLVAMVDGRPIMFTDVRDVQ